jgi:S1-C subfamily serine protease
MTEHETQPYNQQFDAAQLAAAVPPPAPLAAPGATPPPAPPVAFTQPVAFSEPVAWAPAPPSGGLGTPPSQGPTATPPGRPGGRGVGRAALVTAVLATAVVASTGTYFAVRNTGGETSQPHNSLAGYNGQTRQTPAPAGQAAPATPTPAKPGTAAPAPATTGPAPAQGSIVDIVKAVSPAVVTIVADGVTSTDPTTGQTGTGTATGSGIIFDANGLILTNHHVVDGNPSKLTVNLKDGRSFNATIYGIDTMTDLAIVKVDQTGLPTAPIGDSNSIQVGQQAIAIGSPLGQFTDSVTSGIVSAVGRSIDVADGTRLTNLIQTDTAINPGNSGGPLLDGSGSVVGINTAVAGGAQGIGFAIPINIAKPMLAQASAGQKLARPWLGIRFEMIDAAIKSQANLPVDNGAWIPAAGALAQGSGRNGAGAAPNQGPNAQDPNGLGLDPNALGIDPNALGQGGAPAAQQPPIVAGSPAEAAGLKAGDIITAVNGQALTLANPLDQVVSQLAPGQTATLDVLRNGQTIKITVTLGTRPAA